MSDIDGETGIRIIQAIVGGERDPKVLAMLPDRRVRKSTVADPYVPINEAEYEAKAKAQRMEYLRPEAKKMGLELVDTTKAA